MRHFSIILSFAITMLQDESPNKMKKYNWRLNISAMHKGNIRPFYLQIFL